MARFIRWFREIGLSDVATVGGKNASLGEMYQQLVPTGIRIPNGFAVTAEAYRHFLRASGLGEEVRKTLTGLNTGDLTALAECGRRIREAILARPLPDDLRKEIADAYAELCRDYGADTDTAVRSSATAEDLPTASFAGQQESYLNVRGERGILEAVRLCIASLFTDRAISYRVDKGFDHLAVALSVGVQRMVRSDVGAAGVMFTLDTESGFRDVILISSAYGLGESVVKGRVDPDEFLVFKPTLKTGHRPILKRSVGAKQEKLIYTTRGGSTRIVPVPAEDRGRLSLTDDEVLTLARWGCQIEDHYSKKAGQPTPMDIEWGKDGLTGELFILQARPETVHSQASKVVREVYSLPQSGQVLLTGRSVGEKIGAGPVRVVKDVDGLRAFKPGEVLVADMTDPDWEPTMKMAAAIVTNRGGRTCHAAIVSREIGVPCVVGTGTGTSVLKDGQSVTVSCAGGEVGVIYDGMLIFTRREIDLGSLARPKTKVMVNVGNPDQAFALASLPCDGVGLAREEFIISGSIKIHPLALVHFDKVPDGPAKQKIAELTRNHPDKPAYFVERLAEGVARIAAAFYPREVIVRLSDFKTNEYAGLLGGEPFEPKEENPMIGFRGASRYYDPRYKEGFLLECRAMKQVREEMGLTNVKLMVPFCRTVEEGKRVLAVMAEAGLKQGENGLEVYVMCEIPSNVILTEEFAEVFDGFSIGSNDLTQLTLGLDRDSEIVAHLFDERNAAVKKLIADVIRRARACGRKVGICGQAPSDYPEFARFLVACGIDSISLNPDTVLKTTREIVEMEREMQSDLTLTRKGNAMKSNAELEREVLEALRIEPSVDYGHIGVTAVDGVVWLRGTVPGTKEQWQAETVAAGVDGVKRVVNHLEVAPAGVPTPG
ncbi:MAG: phosphoenolpyruvate synthase [Planctomycetes bacterium]|nr:phosphoenolpyruvate synthase [Planctomycetota bacterium]